MKETTAQRLRMIMDERKLRQIDIVRMCEPFCKQYNLTLSKSDLSQFVHGKVVPSQWKISILSHGLNVSEAWLMGYDVPRERKPDLTAEEVQSIVSEKYKEDQVPKTPEARIVSFGMDRLPQADREQILNVIRAMYAKRPELFRKDDNDDA